MIKTLLNIAKSEHCQLDKMSFISMINQGNSPLKSPVLKLLKPSQTYLHNIALKQSILQLETNFITPDIETVELMNDSEYLQRVEMLWGDSAEWL